MDFDTSINCEKTSNVDVPPAYVGLRILLVDHDTNSLSNVATILEEHSFKVTAIEQATVALSILREHIDQFDLVMVDVNMPEMDYLEFLKSTQLIKDKPIILMSPETTTEMVKEAIAAGAFVIYRKLFISSTRLKNVWKHVYWHNKKANKKLQHKKANQVEVMDNTTCTKKLQDGKGKSIEICSETYQDQMVGSLIAKDEPKRSNRMRSTSEGTQVESSGTSEREENHSLISETSIGRAQKKTRCVKWTPDHDRKLDEIVRELGEKARPRHVLERMCVPNLTKKHLTYRLQKYRSQQAPNVQPTTSMKFNEEHHSNMLNSSDFSINFDELFQGAYKPQPPEVPLIASPSSNDYFLDGWNEWDELLELENINAELMPKNQSVTSYNRLDYVPIFGSSTQENVSTSENQNP